MDNSQDPNSRFLEAINQKKTWKQRLQMLKDEFRLSRLEAKNEGHLPDFQFRVVSDGVVITSSTRKKMNSLSSVIWDFLKAHRDDWPETGTVSKSSIYITTGLITGAASSLSYATEQGTIELKLSHSEFANLAQFFQWDAFVEFFREGHCKTKPIMPDKAFRTVSSSIIRVAAPLEKF